MGGQARVGHLFRGEAVQIEKLDVGQKIDGADVVGRDLTPPVVALNEPTHLVLLGVDLLRRGDEVGMSQRPPQEQGQRRQERDNPGQSRLTGAGAGQRAQVFAKVLPGRREGDGPQPDQVGLVAVENSGAGELQVKQGRDRRQQDQHRPGRVEQPAAAAGERERPAPDDEQRQQVQVVEQRDQEVSPRRLKIPSQPRCGIRPFSRIDVGRKRHPWWSA